MFRRMRIKCVQYGVCAIKELCGVRFSVYAFNKKQETKTIHVGHRIPNWKMFLLNNVYST